MGHQCQRLVVRASSASRRIFLQTHRVLACKQAPYLSLRKVIPSFNQGGCFRGIGNCVRQWIPRAWAHQHTAFAVQWMFLSEWCWGKHPVRDYAIVQVHMWWFGWKFCRQLSKTHIQSRFNASENEALYLPSQKWSTTMTCYRWLASPPENDTGRRLRVTVLQLSAFRWP